ncbi:MAG: hypothetical protein R2708_06990 [Vicinamibacterales bacterium]
MSPTLSTFVFELANFALLAALLGWLLFAPVRNALDARQARERERRQALDEREQATARARADIEAARAAFDADCEQQRTARLAAAASEADAVVTRARETATREVARGQRMLAHVEQAQVEHLATAVGAAAHDAVARLLTSVQGPDLQQALVAAACRELRATRPKAGAILVESAAPLADEPRAALAEAAGGSAVTMEFRELPALGAGLRVTTPHGLVDASAAGLAAHAERVLAARLAPGTKDSET